MNQLRSAFCLEKAKARFMRVIENRGGSTGVGVQDEK